MEKKDFFTVPEAANYLRVSAGYVRHLVQKHKISYSRPGGNRIYFTQEDLNAYLGRNRVPSDTELQGKAMNYCL